jgi:hypothetical protein
MISSTHFTRPVDIDQPAPTSSKYDKKLVRADRRAAKRELKRQLKDGSAEGSESHSNYNDSFLSMAGSSYDGAVSRSTIF